MKIIPLKDELYLLGSQVVWILSGRTQSEDSSASENIFAALTYSSSQLAWISSKQKTKFQKNQTWKISGDYKQLE